jgi:hypothetical protein
MVDSAELSYSTLCPLWPLKKIYQSQQYARGIRGYAGCSYATEFARCGSAHQPRQHPRGSCRYTVHSPCTTEVARTGSVPDRMVMYFRDSIMIFSPLSQSPGDVQLIRKSTLEWVDRFQPYEEREKGQRETQFRGTPLPIQRRNPAYETSGICVFVRVCRNQQAALHPLSLPPYRNYAMGSDGTQL